MKKFLLLIVFALFTTSCTTFKDLETGLIQHKGLSIDTLINKIGYPSAEMNIAGRKLYVWSTSQNVSMPSTSTVNTGGTVYSGTNMGIYSGTSTVTTMQNMNFNCKITIEVDDNNIIKSGSYEGNIGGCDRWSRALK